MDKDWAEKNPGSAYLSTLLSMLNLQLIPQLPACGDEEQKEILARITELSNHPGSFDFPLTSEETARYTELLAELEADRVKLLGKESEIPVRELQRRFHLDEYELLILIAVLAPALDIRYRQIFQLLQGSPLPKQDFLLALLENNGIQRNTHAHYLQREGMLLSSCLIEPADGQNMPLGTTAFSPALGLLEWLNGSFRRDFYLGRAELERNVEPDVYAPKLPAAVASSIRMARIGSEPIPIVSIFGRDAAIRIGAAERLAQNLPQPLLKLDLEGLEMAETLRLLRYALRDAQLWDALLVLTGLEKLIDSGGVMPAEIGRLLKDSTVPVAFLTKRSFLFAPEAVLLTRPILRLNFPPMTGSLRLGVWQRELADMPLESDLDETALRTLAGQFELDTAQIHSAAQAALGIAVVEDRSLRIQDLYEGARMSSMHHLADLAAKMPPRYQLDDLILPEKQKSEILELIYRVKNRSVVLEDWGVGQKLVSGRGISALFTGAPGTGKTLAAQVIAGTLGLDIYRVDLSTVVSKYIGDTEKNLEQIFNEAQNSNVILFFDEADSLFGRRSEVGDSHDRYANIEVGYLLQRIEVYDGVVLMATNLGANLDEAFTRRLHFIIDFPFPEEETRLRLWQLLLPKNIPAAPDIDLARLAASYKIAGGNIRNAVVTAVYNAAASGKPIDQTGLLHGVEREYQKMGKVFKS